MSEDNKYVLAMYDVRGIQDYLFRTSKMKDAIGASHIVELLYDTVLNYAVKELGLTADLEWYYGDQIKVYKDTDDVDVRVLYIGGGNACVIYSSREKALAVSRLMGRKTLDLTYSLQLATAIVDKTDDYSADYTKLMEEMVRVKDDMAAAKPVDALPVVKTELTTGFPISDNSDIVGRYADVGALKDTSRESALKIKNGNYVRKELVDSEKMFDSYVSEKGESSMLAVIHIDGNNMGLRIRDLISGKDDYESAVSEMRRISLAINTAYKLVYQSMQTKFNNIRKQAEEKKEKGSKDKWWVMKVVTAGDDITYVCNANIAFATVEFFCHEISKYGMKDNAEDAAKYKFSACAGISYFNSHFPFNIAYEVADACCESAKSRAKEEGYRSEETVGNWVDFQFCRSVHALNLDLIREKEYVTASGENLLRRPYFLPSEELEKADGSGIFRKISSEEISYTEFLKDMEAYVLEKRDKESSIPRSFVKEMRNTYPLGEEQMKLLGAFLQSRETQERKYPDPDDYYFNYKGKRTARFYDALEVADYFHSYTDATGEVLK